MRNYQSLELIEKQINEAVSPREYEYIIEKEVALIKEYTKSIRRSRIRKKSIQKIFNIDQT